MASGFIGLVIQLGGGIIYLVLLLHLLLRLVEADFYNPITQSILRVSNPLSAPLKSFLPDFKRLDTGVLATAIVVNILITQLTIFFETGTVLSNILDLLVWALLAIAYTIMNIYFYALIAVVVLSWIAPTLEHPVARLVWQLTAPVMNFLQRLIPSIGGLDFSPIILLLGIAIGEQTVVRIAMQVQLPAKLVVGI